MYEDRIQNYDPEIHKQYLIHIHQFPCHVIYTYVQTEHIAMLLKNLDSAFLGFLVF